MILYILIFIVLACIAPALIYNLFMIMGWTLIYFTAATFVIMSVLIIFT